MGLVYEPTSFQTLPPPTRPDDRERDAVAELRRSLIRESGLRPGSYTSIDSVVAKQIEDVYDGLQSKLEEVLHHADGYSLCVNLYKRHEEYRGYIAKVDHKAGIRRKFEGIPQNAMAIRRLGNALGLYSETIRWLIEIAVKFCTDSGLRLNDRKVHRSVEIAKAMYEWDLVWEHLIRGANPVEIHLRPNYTVELQPLPGTQEARQRYVRAIAPSTVASADKLFDASQRATARDPFVDSQNMLQTLSDMGLEEGLLEARGYSLTDWGKFCSGLIDFLGSEDYIKAIKTRQLAGYLAKRWELRESIFHNLLNDFGLSKQDVCDVPMQKLRPVEYGRRDTRLLRRPIVLLEHRGDLRCIYGRETVNGAFRMLFDRIQAGRIDFIAGSRNQRLNRAVGKLLSERGKEFEDKIASLCRQRGMDYQREKGKIRQRKLPGDRGFGPVDVFIVDHDQHRFVLVEAKFLSFDEANPRQMKKDRDAFARFLFKLNRQVDWFTKHLPELKSEFEVGEEEEYAVEGVIVVNSLQPWMFLYDRPVPIQDIHNFRSRLARPGDFTIPAATGG